MVINDRLQNNLLVLKQNIEFLENKNSLTDSQIENFLRNFEKIRYNILSEIKMYNKSVNYEYEKIKTIDSEYEARLKNSILKIYVPEVMPSYKNLKTHTHKRILLNIAEVTKKFEGFFDSKVWIYIKIFDNIQGWDVDNKFIKPVSDALILSKVIKDDNITKMSYCVKGEYSEKPHTEIYVFDSKNMDKFLEEYCI